MPRLSQSDRPPRIRLLDRQVAVTEVFWSYWYLAAERQAMFNRRVSGLPRPWTNDPVLANYRFTNAYRASDRVSQYLLQHVIYDDERNADDTIFRVLLFKIFNRIETWNYLVETVGQPTLATFDPGWYSRTLDRRLKAGNRIYSPV